ncbi:MAG: DUF3857 domain-containing protein [Myxococcota bacterium]
MSRVLVGIAILALAACGGSARNASDLSIEELRTLAAENPRDSEIQTRLAIGELLMTGGDIEQFPDALERARALAPNDPRLPYLSGLRYDLQGDPEQALQGYIQALQASRDGGPLRDSIAEASIASVADLEDVAPGFDEAVRAALDTDGQGTLGFAARHHASMLLVQLAYRSGDTDRVRAVAETAGCPQDWRVAGPFGPRALLGFDETLAPESDQTLLDEYTLGPVRGPRTTRSIETRGCALHLGGGPLAESGTTYAEATIEAPTSGAYQLRLETPNASELFIDGDSVARLDHRAEPAPRVSYVPVRLDAGSHQIRVKITTRHPNPILVLALLPDAVGEGEGTALPEINDPLTRYLRAVIALSRGNAVTARESLVSATQEAEASSAMLQLRAAVTLADPLSPNDMRRDNARRFLRMAARRDPQSWYPAYQLATLDAADNRVLQAIELLRGAEERWPKMVRLPLMLSDLLMGRGWYSQADEAVARANRILPEGCRSIRALLSSAQRRNRWDEAEELIDRLVTCDARSNARLEHLMRSRHWDRAAEELDRLASLEPPQARLGALLSRLEIERGRDDAEAMAAILEELAEINPQSPTPTLAQIDRLLASNRSAAAQTLIDQRVQEEPASLAELHLIQKAIGGPFVLEAYRQDGELVRRAFEEGEVSYDQPQVLVFDYTVARVFEDGSSIELTHNIWRIQSEEAVDDRGEFSPPDGARILQLHTVKADGRRLEPDEIAGKSDISLPSLAVGDYVEYEYITFSPPPSGFPGGYLGNRFYFRSPEIPYHTSQLTVVLPATMETVLDPRGDAPDTEEIVENGLRTLRWTARESRPFRAEPSSVPAREFIPSINLGVNATWRAFVESLLDALADKDVRDPAAERQLRQILGDAVNAAPRVKAQRLYRWVLGNIEDNDNLFGMAPVMLAQRNGDRARILRYLLKLANVETTLVLARGLRSDITESEVADADTYRHVLLMLPGNEPSFLYTAERGAPFGYLPPTVRGQEALVLAPGAPRVRIPEGEAGVDRRSVELTAVLENDGSARVEVVETFRGAGAVSWRRDLEGVPEATLEQRFEEAYVARLVPGARMTELRITGRRNARQPLVLSYAFEVAALGRRDGDAWVVPGLFPTMLTPVIASTGERQTPQLIGSAVDIEAKIRIEAPSGTELSTPEPVSLRGPNGSFLRLTSSREGAALLIERRVNVPIMRIPAAEYPTLAAFAQSVDRAEAQEIRLRF